MTESAISLNQPVAASGAARTFFFNGRLLSAEDLRREQALRENGQSQLARLIGCGIAAGLEVGGDSGSSALSIGAGLGVTPSGLVIDIDNLDLDLAGSAGGARSGGFATCAAAMANLASPAAGLYLLVLTPTWIGSGRAATLLGEVGACNRNVEQPAVRARLLGVSAPSGATEQTVRNQVAHALLAPDDPAAVLSNAAAAEVPSGALRLIGWWPASSAPTLSADDLPLALLRIDQNAEVVWLDGAAARRRIAPPPGLAGDTFWRTSHAIEMEAFARQFVDQLADEAALLKKDQNAPGAAAFAALPPVALLSKAQLDLLFAFFATSLALAREPFTVDRGEFVQAMREGLDDATGTVAGASAAVLHLRGSDRYLFRLRYRHTATIVEAVGDERSSKRLASLAGRTLHDRNADATKRSLAASVLTQAPNRTRRAPKG